MNKKTVILPVLLIIIGTGWLLTTLGIAPDIDWIWTLGLGATGVLTFVVGGLTKPRLLVGHSSWSPVFCRSCGKQNA